jgi:uncharacterized protein (DUF2062 family)
MDPTSVAMIVGGVTAGVVGVRLIFSWIERKLYLIRRRKLRKRRDALLLLTIRRERKASRTP